MYLDVSRQQIQLEVSRCIQIVDIARSIQMYLDSRYNQNYLDVSRQQIQLEVSRCIQIVDIARIIQMYLDMKKSQSILDDGQFPGENSKFLQILVAESRGYCQLIHLSSEYTSIRIYIYQNLHLSDFIFFRIFSKY